MKKVISVFVIMLALVGSVGFAQVPVAVPEDELVTAWLDTVKVAGQFANSECQQLASAKQFNDLRRLKQSQIEARLPGYTVDWNQYKVVAKKPVTSEPAK